MSAWKAPLPRPEDLERYEQVVPGSAAQIVSSVMAQQAHVRELEVVQSDHRRVLENHVVRGTERRANIGQWTAFFIAVSAIVVGAVVATIGHDPKAGSAVVVAVFAGGAIIYFLGGKPPKKSKSALKSK
jgi:uncharacterized membrane protein